ncbi:unnamed protein product [Phaedon cochleariae]|uniref:Zinc finger protein chinmo n=1 Tax=Phaedon cochleariae TaxID=80249 RepID=A0A9P0DV94_PHACE|nr:unnamed protein product [Phaedon cochleariae]
MDPQQQQFCLKWNSFGSNLTTSCSNLFKSESLADVTLFCDGVTFKAHKLILAACSKHLADLFDTAPLHQTLLVILDNTSAANMSALLEFMYRGEVHVAQDSLSSFLKAAECLQVKGLSIEHEKLAVAQTVPAEAVVDSPTRKHLKVLKEEMDSTPLPNSTHHQSSPSPSYSPSMSPYMHQQHLYRHQYPDQQQQQRCPTSGTAHPYDRRPQRSPTDSARASLCSPNESARRRSPNTVMQESVRASVLRDGSRAAGRPGSPGPLSLGYRPSSSSSSLPGQEGAQEGAGEGGGQTCVEGMGTEVAARDPGCPEDLRMKMDPAASQQDESPSSTAGGGNGSGGGPNSSTGGGPNGFIGPQTKYNHDRDKDLIPASLWSTVAGKLSHKTGTVNTPDGKKLKCPFCERLYGYETNLRAHIRQRHQGIRVPCPFCSRTFTRNNTVRRHIAREHKTELSLKAYQQTQQQHQQQHQQQQVHP